MMIKAFDGIKSKDDKRICCTDSKSFFVSIVFSI